MVKIAQTTLERALGNLHAMARHIDAMELTVAAFAGQMEAAKQEIAIMRLDLNEVEFEIRAAVKRLEELRTDPTSGVFDRSEDTTSH